jgi:hypothetical protein
MQMSLNTVSLPSTFLAGRPVRQIGEQFHLAAPARYGIQHQPNGDKQKCHQHQSSRQHRSRQPWHQTGLQIGDHDRDREADGSDRQRQGDPGEECQRPFGAIEPDTAEP